MAHKKTRPQKNCMFTALDAAQCMLAHSTETNYRQTSEQMNTNK